MAERPEVVITGLGAVTPYGCGVGLLWDGLLESRPTARQITRFDATGFAVRFACEVAGFDPFTNLPRKLVRQVDSFGQYALVAAEEALGQAGLLGSSEDDGLRVPIEGVDPDRIGTVVASGAGGIQEMTEQLDRLRAVGPDRVRPYLTIAMPANMGGGQIALRHGLRGPSYSVVSACASAGDAVGSALDLIRAGRVDVVVAGGAEAAITPLMVAGFAAGGALSRRNDDPQLASRPFDVHRDGFVLGEGAGLLVLERADHAAARGARSLAVLAGYGVSNDAHHATRPPPGGEGAARALRLALADAGLEPGDVDHLNAHGTSTPLNDPAEAAAIRAVFGSRTDEIPVTSTKSAIGHLLGAAGGVEAVATVQALARGVVPPTQNLEELDPDCPLDVVHGQPRPAPPGVALSNSFGFGGHNAVLAMTSVDQR
ncbi:MAG TPA: beta-ketoacyl-ACP synthase II [Egibacteraceae bacterium]|nr:beta-ketoacyl-ACP synthase II [Egibacteraceae bacterium]